MRPVTVTLNLSLDEFHLAEAYAKATGVANPFGSPPGIQPGETATILVTLDAAGEAFFTQFEAVRNTASNMKLHKDIFDAVQALNDLVRDASHKGLEVSYSVHSTGSAREAPTLKVAVKKVM